MAWRVGLMCGDALSQRELDTVVRYMPVWATQTPTNVALADEIRRKAEGLWASEPVFTLFDSHAAECVAILPTIEEHHPAITKIEIFGVIHTPALDRFLQSFGFISSSRPWPGAIGYRKPLEASTSQLQRIELNASNWHSKEDVYAGVLQGLQAPAWHGHNFNALKDSIMTGGINGSEPPFVMAIFNSRHAANEAQMFMNDLAELFQEFIEEGCPVSFTLA